MSGPLVTVRHDEEAVEDQRMCTMEAIRVGLDVHAEITYEPGQTQAVDRLAANLRRQIADAAERPARGEQRGGHATMALLDETSPESPIVAEVPDLTFFYYDRHPEPSALDTAMAEQLARVAREGGLVVNENGKVVARIGPAEPRTDPHTLPFRMHIVDETTDLTNLLTAIQRPPSDQE